MAHHVQEKLPFLQDPQTSWSYAIHREVAPNLLITDRNGEAPVIGPHDVDEMIMRALDLQCLSLTSIQGGGGIALGVVDAFCHLARHSI